MPRPDLYVYPPEDRPAVEVEVDGDWYPGQATARTDFADGRVQYQVSWGHPRYRFSDRFPAARVCWPETDVRF